MFYGWWIVCLAFLGSAFGGATIWYGFTAYFDPLISEFGWSYTAISVAASFRGVETGVLDIFVGFLVDRFGSRRIVLVGSMIAGIGFLMLSRANSLATFYMSFFIIFLGASGISSVVFFQVVIRWFHKRLGLVLGLVSAGVGAGGFAVPGIVYLLDLVGLRMVFVINGLAVITIGCLTTLFLRSRPEDMGFGPDGIPLQENKPDSEFSGSQMVAPGVHPQDYSVKEAIADRSFWIISYASIITGFSIMMVCTHVMPYLEHIGYSRYIAGITAMMIPATSIVGRLGIGWLSDLFGRKNMFVFAMLGQTAGMVLFLFADLPFSLVLSVMLFGISFGGNMVLRPSILRHYYGQRCIGSLLGLSIGITVIGSVGGPLLGGWIFDTTHSYDLAWIIGSILLVFGIPWLVTMKKPVPRQATP